MSAFFGMLMILQAGGEADGPGGPVVQFPGGIYPHSSDLWILMLGIILLALSGFFLQESAKLQKWTFTKEEHAPQPSSGLIFSWVSAAGIIICWTVSQMYMSGLFFQPFDLPVDCISAFIKFIFLRPQQSFPAFSLASALIATVAFYKFLISGLLLHYNRSDTASRRSPLMAFVGLTFAALNFLGSIATLLGFYETHHPK